MPKENIVEQDVVVDLISETPSAPERKGYEYYVNKQQEAEDTDTTNVVTEEEAPAKVDESPDVPEKFKGKSVEEIIASYTQLEAEFGRRNNEVGQLRKLNDQLLELDTPKESKPAERKKVGVDSLLDDPDTTINEAVESNPKLQKLENSLVKRERREAKREFESKHPKWEDTLKTPEFLQWVSESNIRKQLLIDADQNYEFDKADELFTLYDQIKGRAVEEAKSERSEKARESVNQQVTENQGVTEPSSKEKFKRSEIIHLKLHNRAKYDAMRDRIMSAYADNRVINDLRG